MSPNGAANALIAGTPPEVCAGKNFTVPKPNSKAACTSVAVTAPGNTATPNSPHRSTTTLDKPGDTTNRAPASTARSTCSTDRTVPAPTNNSGYRLMASMAPTAADVRNVTSATGKPPATKASAKPAARPTSSSTTTGTNVCATTGARFSFTVTSGGSAFPRL